MIDFTKKEDYKIFTMDDNGSLLIGHLEVKDMKCLKKLRDEMLENKFYN